MQASIVIAVIRLVLCRLLDEAQPSPSCAIPFAHAGADDDWQQELQEACSLVEPGRCAAPIPESAIRGHLHIHIRIDIVCVSMVPFVSRSITFFDH